MNSGALLPVDHRLLAALAAHNGPQGICPSTRRLAALVGVSRRYVFERLAKLEHLGLLERVPVFEKPDDLEWRRRGRAPLREGRRTTTSYRLRGGGQFIGPNEPGPRTEQGPVSPNGAGQTPMNSAGEARGRVHPLTEVSREQGECGNQQPPKLLEVRIEPPASALLNHDPTSAEVLATLEQAFGPVEVERWPEDSQPPRPAYELARGQRVDLERVSLAEFRRALDQLNRDSCWGDGDRCLPGQNCRRHRRRRQAP